MRVKFCHVFDHKLLKIFGKLFMGVVLPCVWLQIYKYFGKSLLDEVLPCVWPSIFFGRYIWFLFYKKYDLFIPISSKNLLKYSYVCIVIFCENISWKAMTTNIIIWIRRKKREHKTKKSLIYIQKLLLLLVIRRDFRE